MSFNGPTWLLFLIAILVVLAILYLLGVHFHTDAIMLRHMMRVGNAASDRA